MKIRLPPNHSIGASLIALAAGLVRDAAGQLSGTTSADSIHRARVALKKARSILRLLEKAGADWALMPRYRLGELSGRVSAAREAAVVVELAGKAGRRLSGPARQVMQLLAARERLVPSPDASEVSQALDKEARDLVTAPPPAISPRQLRELLRCSLERVTRRYLAAAAEPSLETVHEWRKALIVLRDQTGVAADRWPKGAGRARPLLIKFSRRLGRRGDLALLVRRLEHPWVPPGLERARRRQLSGLKRQCDQATLTALLCWLRLEATLAHLLSEDTRARR